MSRTASEWRKLAMKPRPRPVKIHTSASVAWLGVSAPTRAVVHPDEDRDLGREGQRDEADTRRAALR